MSVGEGVGLDAGQPRAGERGRAVARDLDVAGALAFDDGGVVVAMRKVTLTPSSFDRYATNGVPALGDARGRFSAGTTAKRQFPDTLFPVLREADAANANAAAAGKNDATSESWLSLLL